MEVYSTGLSKIHGLKILGSHEITGFKKFLWQSYYFLLWRNNSLGKIHKAYYAYLKRRGLFKHPDEMVLEVCENHETLTHLIQSYQDEIWKK